MLSYRIIDQGNWSVYASRLGISNPSYQIFTARQYWAGFWSSSYKRPLPEVDFTNHFVIYITQGQKKTGGYGLSIVNVAQQTNQLNGNRLMIVLEMGEPGPGQAVDLGETNPYVIAQIESPTFFRNEAHTNGWQIEFVQQLNGQLFPVDIRKIPKESIQP